MINKMDYKTWARTFGPVEVLETYGEDLDRVREVLETDPYRVWTEIDEDGEGFIIQGAHFVNRWTYRITEIPYNPEETYEVTL
jgi:hypothetical protein